MAVPYEINSTFRVRRAGRREGQLISQPSDGWWLGFILLLTLVFTAESAVRESPGLTRVIDVLQISNAEADQGHAARLRGVATFVDSESHRIFVQDETGGISVQITNAPPTEGESVTVEGITGRGKFAPIVRQASVQSGGPAPLPAPWHATLHDLNSGQHNGLWVEVSGVVHSAVTEEGWLVLKLLEEGDQLDVRIKNPGGVIPDKLVDAVVRVRGVCAGVFNFKDQWISAHLLTPSLAELRVVEAGAENPFDLITRPISSLWSYSRQEPIDRRVHVQGIVTYYRPGRSMFLRDESGEINAQTVRPAGPAPAVAPGDTVELVGFRALDRTRIIMVAATYRKISSGPPPRPQPITAEEGGIGKFDSALVSVEGRLMEAIIRGNELVLTLRSGPLIFGANLDADRTTKSTQQLRTGSRLRLTGICLTQPEAGRQLRTFRVLLRTADDLQVLAGPPWLTPAHLSAALAVSGALACAALLWVWALRRRVNSQTAQLRRQFAHEAELEKRCRELFENAHDLIFTLNRAGCFNALNPAVERALGRPPEKLLSTQFISHLAPAGREQFQSWLDHSFRGDIKQHVEIAVQPPDGRRLVLEISARMHQPSPETPELQCIARDITEFKQAEDALRASEMRFRELFENSPDPLFVEDEAGVVLDCNPAACRLHGLGRAALLGRTVFELVPPDKHEEIRRDFPRLFKGELKHIEGVSLADDGRRVPVDIHAARVNYSGRPCLLLLARDVSERKRAEDLVRASEARYRNLVETSSDLIWAVDAEGRFNYLNQNATHRIFGCSPEEMLGRSFTDFEPPDQLARDYAALARILAGESIFQHETVLHRQDGTLVHLSANAVPARDEHGVIIGATGTASDITQHKQAEAALLNSREQFFKIFNTCPMCISINQPADGRFLDVNLAFTRVTGYSREETIGRTPLDLNLWLNPQDRQQLVRQVHDTKSVRNFAATLRAKSGETRHVLAFVESIELSGEPCHLFLVHDVTEQHDLEDKLRHAQKMEAVGQLAAGVAHDFNNLLTIIRGHADLMRTETRAPGTASPALDQITSAADRAANLTRQLLTFSRRQVMQIKPLDLNEVVGSACAMLQRLLGERVTVQFTACPGLPPIAADIAMLELVIVNLALNARDAMPQGGRLNFTPSVAKVDAQHLRQTPDARAGRFVCLSVTDTGQGMDAETLSHIFEPFFTTKDVGKGTGLGLATVYGVIKQHNGWIEVTSEVSRGTTFHIYLPADTRSGVASASPASAGQAERGAETILVVEDEPALRELVVTILVSYGYRVVSAGHGKEALALWQRHAEEINLLLTDMVMPEGISGWELAAQLTAANPRLKVIYTSGYSPELFGNNVELKEGVNFLAKPYQPGTLAKTVRDCLDKERPLTPPSRG